MIFYCVGILLSYLMQGEFSVPTSAFGLCLVLYILFQVLRLETYNPFDLMSGKHYLDPNTFLLRGQLPWLPLITFSLGALTTLFISVKVADARDF